MRQKSKREKPRYNMWQNTLFMIQTAWREEKSVLFLCVLPALLAVAINAMELIIAPAILRKVETAVPVVEVLLTIAFFALGLLSLQALLAYVDTNVGFGRIAVREGLGRKVGQKVVTMSYPLTEDPAVEKRMAKANMVTCTNTSAGEAIWGTWTEIIKNVLGFLLYLALLSALQPVLILVILLTALAGSASTSASGNISTGRKWTRCKRHCFIRGIRWRTSGPGHRRRDAGELPPGRQRLARERFVGL